MIRLTKWMNPDEFIYKNRRKITVMEWAKEQKRVIERRTGKETYIKTKDGKIAIYRERIK